MANLRLSGSSGSRGNSAASTNLNDLLMCAMGGKACLGGQPLNHSTTPADSVELTPPASEMAFLIATFERILSTDGVGRSKPHPDVYRHAADSAGVKPGETMLIAAHPWDVDYIGQDRFGAQIGAQTNRSESTSCNGFRRRHGSPANAPRMIARRSANVKVRDTCAALPLMLTRLSSCCAGSDGAGA